MQKLEMKLEQQSQKLNEQEQRLNEREEIYSKDVQLFAKNSIITVACELLLFHFGNQPQEPTKSNRVQYS